VKDHLKNVYATLAMCMAMAAVGVIVNSMFALHSFHFLFSLGSIGLMIAIMATEATREKEKKRLGYMVGSVHQHAC
jgi:hypothetical protein